jgi:hypothetical protein
MIHVRIYVKSLAPLSPHAFLLRRPQQVIPVIAGVSA